MDSNAPTTSSPPAASAPRPTAAAPSSSAPPFPFQPFRRLHFGVTGRPAHCIYCAHPRPHRWGRFSGRQRYRCTACHRTFSDFTGTPLAHLKQIDRWPGFGRCVLASLTVRRTAALLGIHRATAFRWRHRVLSALDAADTAPLLSPVVIHETWFPFSEKGRRDLDRPPRRRSVFGRLDIPKAWLYYAGDGTGRMASGLVGSERPTAEDLSLTLHSRIDAKAVIASTFGPWGAAGLLAERTRRSYQRMDRRDPEFAAVHRSILTMRRWLPRFHGVATRYLQNYAVWHRFLEWTRSAATGGAGSVARGAARIPAPGSAPCRHAAPPHWLLVGAFP